MASGTCHEDGWRAASPRPGPGRRGQAQAGGFGRYAAAVPEGGDLIGPYRLLDRLGRGAMGEVWRARDERLDRLVALKLLPAELDDPERRARMLREARAAAAVPHRNVVTLYDVTRDGERDVLVMELVEGQTLAERLRAAGPPPLAEALRWLDELCAAMEVAHERGVLHRDLKTANVMLAQDCLLYTSRCV